MKELTTLLIILGFATSHHAADLPDLALQPARVITDIGPDHAKIGRGSQGVCTIERTRKGRLWAAWYAATSKTGVESPLSYVVLATSGDDGTSWTEKLVLQAPRLCHTYDPCLWIDPAGKLWFFWAQSAGLQDGRMGVWCMTTEQVDVEMPVWTEPLRISNGVMLNKPTVLKSGAWLLAIGTFWDSKTMPNIPFKDEEIAPYTVAGLARNLGEERGTNVLASTDAGKTFERIGQVRIAGTAVDEPMIVERRDGSLVMLVRNLNGIAQSISIDGGRTWSDEPMFLTLRETASSRFFLRRLPSGALLLIRNAPPAGRVRTHMSAFLSDDDGATWTGGLLLDERECSYPDATFATDGTIRVIYDHLRFTDRGPERKGVGAVMMAVLREEDARAGKPVSADSRLHVVISQLLSAQ